MREGVSAPTPGCASNIDTIKHHSFHVLAQYKPIFFFPFLHLPLLSTHRSHLDSRSVSPPRLKPFPPLQLLRLSWIPPSDRSPSDPLSSSGALFYYPAQVKRSAGTKSLTLAVAVLLSPASPPGPRSFSRGRGEGICWGWVSRSGEQQPVKCFYRTTLFCALFAAR